jgi:hypothetical protein
VLGTGAAFGVRALLGKDADNDPGGEEEGFALSAAGLVVNNAPDLGESPKSHFAQGYSQSWTIPAIGSDVTNRELGVAESGIVAGEFVSGDQVITGLDRADGTALWSETEASGGIYGCENAGHWGKVFCVSSGDLAHYSLVLPLSGNAMPVPSGDTGDTWGCHPKPLETGILWICTVAEFYDQPITGYVAAWSDPDGKVLWTGSEVPAVEEDPSDSYAAADEHQGLVAYSSPMVARDMLFESANGNDVLEGITCRNAQIFDNGSVWCHDNEVTPPDSGQQCSDPTWQTDQITLSGGSTITLHRTSGYPLDFPGGNHPRDTVYLSGCGMSVLALDAATGDELYEITDRPIVSAENYWGAYNGRNIVAVLDLNATITAVDVSTGEVLWDRAGTQARVETGPGWARLPDFLDRGTLAVQTARSDEGTASLEVFDAYTGDLVLSRGTSYSVGEWQNTQGAYWYWSRAWDAGEPYVIEDSDQSLTLWEANAQVNGPQGESADPPEGVPPCPHGQHPLIWSQVGKDYVIVCATEDGSGFAVAVRQDGKGLKPVELTFTDGGCSVELSDGGTVHLSLGGAYVTRTDRTILASSSSWAWNAGRVEFTDPPPEGALTCPKGSWPISLSTYGDGHVLVCGESADKATSLKWQDHELGHGESDQVRAQAGGWCATVGGVKACSFPDPALVAYTRDGASESVQRPVSSSYFAD